MRGESLGHVPSSPQGTKGLDGRTRGVKACAGDGGTPWDTSHPVHWGPRDWTDKGSKGLCRGWGESLGHVPFSPLGTRGLDGKGE